MKYGVPTQKDIFLRGMAGIHPEIPVSYCKLKEKVRVALSPEAFAYFAGGAGMESTMRANREAFSHYKLKPRMMHASGDIDLSVKLFGKKYSSPFLAAPIGVLELGHKDADLAVARACKTMNVPMVFSNQASYSMEECATEMGTTPRWFQLYWSKSEKLVRSLVSRAEESDCEAIVVTLDTTSLGWRPRDLDLGYLPFLRAQGIAQYSSDPVFKEIINEKLEDETMGSDEKPPINLTTLRNLFLSCKNYPGSFFNNLFSGRATAAVKTFVNIYMRPELRWSDLKELRTMTNLPILVKGVHTAEDAGAAISAGVDGIVVSNHGGRQVDGAIGALKGLDEITDQYGGDTTILFDSGIRSGADVVKALALGADAVLLGRPYIYGLSIAGQEGVETVFRYFLSEIELQMSLMGVDSIADLDRRLLT